MAARGAPSLQTIQRFMSPLETVEAQLDPQTVDFSSELI
jgi:hypothetical protein